METWHFISALCKQKVKTFFLSTLIVLSVKWVPRLTSTITSTEETLNVCEQNFFKEIKTKSRVTCNLPVQHPSCWMWHLTFSWVRFLSSKLEFMYCNIKITKAFFFSQPVFWYVVLFDKKLIALHHCDNTFLFYFDICTGA